MRREVDFLDAEPFVCAEWAEGQAASLRAGLAQLEDADAVVVTLGDQPGITPQVVAMIVDCQDSPAVAARAVYGGRPGHPVLLKRALFPRVTELRGDVGARPVLAQVRVREIEAAHLCNPLRHRHPRGPGGARGCDLTGGTVGPGRSKRMQRLSPQDASFLHLEDLVSHMHIGAVAILEGPPPPYDELAARVEANLQLAPRYRQKVHFVPLALGRPVWVDDPHFNLSYHLRCTALPAPGGDEQLRLLVGRVMSQQLDRHKPLWEMWMVEGLSEQRWVLLSKMHHAVVDGVSGRSCSRRSSTTSATRNLRRLTPGTRSANLPVRSWRSAPLAGGWRVPSRACGRSSARRAHWPSARPRRSRAS